MKIDNSRLRALASLLGTTIGAGIFALPYVCSRLGFLIFTPLLLLVSFVSTFINQTYVRIVEATHGDHQLPGYASIYLGKWGKRVTFVSLALGLYGALTAYLIQGGEFLSSLSPLERPSAGLVFWGVFSLVVLLGLVAASWGEAVISFGIVLLIGALSFYSLSKISWRAAGLISFLEPQLTDGGEFISLLGVMLFAFGGASAVPEVEEIVRGRDDRNLSGVVKASATLVTGLYFLFSFAVVVVSGRETSPAALEGLAGALGGTVTVIAPLIGILALGSSFLLLAYSLREIFFRDFRLPVAVSWFFSLVPPVVIYLLSHLGFIAVLSLAGSVGIGLSWLLILLICKRVSAFPNP